MPSDRFKIDQVVIVSHLQADGKRVEYHGKVVEHVNDTTWKIEMVALGMFMLLNEEDIRDG